MLTRVFGPILNIKIYFFTSILITDISFRSDPKSWQKYHHYLTAVDKVEDGDEIVELDPVQENDRFGQRVLVQQVEEERTA